jgi:hypothetical protein
MGVSTDAILFYGYCIADEDDPSPWDSGEWGEWEDVYMAAIGDPEPSSPYSDETREEHSAYWERERAALRTLGAKIDSHCSLDCPMYYVAATESVLVASRGYPHPLSESSLSVGGSWRDSIAKLCDALGVSVEGEPRWFLVSMWR